MKALKILGIVLVSLVVLLAVVVVIALLPPVQTWAARRAVAGQPGAKIEFSRVAAGPGSTEISDLRVTQDGIVITAKTVSTRYSAWDYLLHRRLNIDDITAEGLVVDVRNVKPGAAKVTVGSASISQGNASPVNPSSTVARPSGPGTSTPTTFNGALGNVQLPVDVHLAKVTVDGQVLLPDERTVAFAVHGSQIVAGKEHGRIEWKVDFADPKKDSRVRAAHATGALGLHLTTDRRIDAIDLTNELALEGAGLPTDRVKFELTAAQPVVRGDEHYTARVSLLRSEKTLPLLNARVDYQAESHQLAGTWEVAVQSDEVGALLAGFGLPDLVANGAGKFTFHPDSSTGATSGELTAQVTKLEKISSVLAPLGTVQVHAMFDAGLAGQLARLEHLELTVAKSDGGKLVDVATVQKIEFDLAHHRISLAHPESELAHVVVQALPLPWAQSFANPLTIDGGDLSLSLGVEAEPDGSRVRLRALEPVTLRDLTVRDGQRVLVDRLALSLRPTIDYSAEKIIAELGEITASTPMGDSVTGKVSAQISELNATPVIAFSAQIQAKVVAALKPYLPPIDFGPLTLVKNVEGKLQGGSLEIAKASVLVKRGEALLASFESQQAITANLKTLAVSTAQPDETAVRVRLGEVPLAWAEPFVANSRFDGALAGGAFDVILHSKDQVALRTTAPVEIHGLGVTMNGQQLAHGLDLAAEFTAAKLGATIAYDLRQIEIKQAGASLLKLRTAGEATPGEKLAASAKGELEVDLAAMFRQPIFASSPPLARGNVKASFDATLGDTIAANATVTVRNLTAKQNNQALGDVDLVLDATAKPDGSGNVKMPFTLNVGGRRSDMTVDGTYAKTAGAFSFNGKLSSVQLIADDLQVLAALAPSNSAAPGGPNQPATPAPTTAAPVRDAAPFWKGVGGRFEIDLKRIQYGKDFPITGIHGSATVADTRVALEGLEGKLRDAPFAVNATLTFDANKPQPYALAGSAGVKGFDLGAFLRAANPNEAPVVETHVSVDAKVSGNGVNAADLAQNAYGTFNLSGTKGVLRALKGKVGTAVGMAGKVLSLFGSASGSDTTAAVGELTSEVSEMAFDSFSLHAERAANLDTKLTSVEFISATKRLTGSGSVQHQKGVPFDQLPLNVKAQLAGKDHFALVLRRLDLLGEAHDDKGYTLMKQPFVIKGTVGKPDSSQFWDIIKEPAMKGAGNLLEKLMTR